MHARHCSKAFPNARKINVNCTYYTHRIKIREKEGYFDTAKGITGL